MNADIAAPAPSAQAQRRLEQARLENRLHGVVRECRRDVARLQLAALDIEIDTLTDARRQALWPPTGGAV